MVRELLLERAAAERGEPVERPSRRRARPDVGRLPGRLLPQRAAATGPRSAGPDAMSEDAARGRRRRGPGRRRARPVAGRGRGHRRGDEVQRRRRRHRGRPRRRGADPGADRAPPVPTTRSWVRRATTSRAPPASAGSSTRSTARSTSSTACRSTPSRSPPRSTAWSSPGVVLNIATGVEFTAYVDDAGGRRGRAATASRSGSGRRCRWRSGWSAPASRYDAGLRELQAQALVRLIPRIRDIRRLGSCALDLCHVAEGTLDGYVEEGVNLWDHAAGGLVARGRRRRGRGHHRRGRRAARAVRAGGRIRRAQGCCRRGGVPGGRRREPDAPATGNSPGHRLFTRRIGRRCVATAGDGAQSGAPTASDRGGVPP